MTDNSHISNKLAKEFPHLPTPIKMALEVIMQRGAELCHPDARERDFAEIERDVVGAVAETGRMMLKGLIEERDDGAPSILRDGRRWHRAGLSKGTAICLLGKLEFRRPLYRRRGERHSACPVDDSLGLLAGSMTRPAGKPVAHVMSQCTLRQAVGIFELSGGMMPSVSGMQRLMDQLHGALAGADRPRTVLRSSPARHPAQRPLDIVQSVADASLTFHGIRKRETNRRNTRKEGPGAVPAAFKCFRNRVQMHQNTQPAHKHRHHRILEQTGNWVSSA